MMGGRQRHARARCKNHIASGALMCRCCYDIVVFAGEHRLYLRSLMDMIDVARQHHDPPMAEYSPADVSRVMARVK